MSVAVWLVAVEEFECTKLCWVWVPPEVDL